MANLWRTQRPRLPLYQSDGFGRDFYIKCTNGGFWEGQYVLSKKPDYIRHKYSNFHSLFHLAAPFKYWGDGSGRENYILKCNGFIHDQKPLCSYELTDFLRNGKDIKGLPDTRKKKVYFSLAEKKYNQQLKNLQKKLVKRLYTEPMKKKKKIKIEIQNGNNRNQFSLKNFGYQTCGSFNNHFNTMDNCKNDECVDKNKLYSLKRENSYNHYINNAKTLENNTLYPKFKKNMKIKNYNTFDNISNVDNNSLDTKKKKIKKINFLTPQNKEKTKNELAKDIYDELGYKKAVVFGKLINKKIKVV